MPPQCSAFKVPEATSSATIWLWSIKSYRPSLPGTRPTCRRPVSIADPLRFAMITVPTALNMTARDIYLRTALAARYALPDLLCLAQDSLDFYNLTNITRTQWTNDRLSSPLTFMPAEPFV